MPDQSYLATPSDSPQHLRRRHWLAGAGGATTGFTIVKPALVGAAEANRKVNLGLIGCGGRGRWITDLFQKHGGYNIAGVFDYFADRADQAGDQFAVAGENRYSGLYGYRKLLEQRGLDAVAIESPPYFHPGQAADAVAAGKHVYLAKPVAVDVPGCTSVEQSGRQASARKLVFLVDFQTRAMPAFQEAVARVHRGDIGKLINGEAAYFCSLYFKAMDEAFAKSNRSPEARLRAWAVDRVLSGDIITEQNIHALDVASWIMNAAPIKARGTGGRARDFVGDCWDHFAVTYYYPDDVQINFSSKQYGAGCDDILCRVYGLQGTIDTHYFGEVNVIGDEPFKGGRMQNLYQDGPINNIATFHQSILQGDFANPTVAPSVRSNLVTILGRTAAYNGGREEVTWEGLLRRNERFEFPVQALRNA